MNNGYTVDLVCKPGSSVDKVFEQMKYMQEAKFAGRDTNIVFNGVRVPAGYYDEFEQFFSLYNSIVEGDVSKVVSCLPADLSYMDANRMLSVCSDSMVSLGKSEISDEVRDEICDSYAERSERSR